MIRRFLLPLALLACPSTPWAGTAVRLGVRDLLDRSELCLEGRVIGARAVLEAHPRRIDTEYTIQVARTYWGEPQAVRVIRIPGGVLPDGRGMTIPGLPRLSVGEDAILFLSGADRSGMRMPVGLAQGRLRVASDRFGRKVLVRDADGLSVVDPGGGAPRAVEAPAVLDYAGTVTELEAAVARRRSR